jgi:hypothetical protein
MKHNIEALITKSGLLLGSITATMTLASFDLILAIALKSISIVSFLIVIGINLEQFVEKIKKLCKKK